MKKYRLLLILLLFTAACQPAQATLPPQGTAKKVMAVESFLADIAQNIAGQRFTVYSLIPLGTDPHTFEPTPADLTAISSCTLLIINGAGLEGGLNKIIENAGGNCQVVEASAGLASRSIPGINQTKPAETDPHFFMDPHLTIDYVENIRDSFAKIDPAGQAEYERNAARYIEQLNNLDAWITNQVAQIPVERRLLVSNHESLGYYADRYHFQVVGTLLTSASSEAQPSAQQIAQLIETIHQTGVKAIFLETGNNPDLAQRIAQDTGIQIVNDLYEHSLSDQSGPASTYIEMMKYNTSVIVNALK